MNPMNASLRNTLACATVALAASTVSAQCVDFEVPPGGSPWPCCGTVFAYNGVGFRTEPFFWIGGGMTVAGFAEPSFNCPAGGGLGLWTNNVNVDIRITDFSPSGVRELTIKYADFGGNVNLQVNGSLENNNDFALIPNNRWHPWGVDYFESSVVAGGAQVGTIVLRALPGGCINQVAIGGQELCIDEICPGEPCACPGDITGPNGVPDGAVDALDFLELIAQWGSPCGPPCTADITGPGNVPDGKVDALDYLLMISQWGNPANCP
jgi:hypothetical protein